MRANCGQLTRLWAPDLWGLRSEILQLIASSPVVFPALGGPCTAGWCEAHAASAQCAWGIPGGTIPRLSDPAKVAKSEHTGPRHDQIQSRQTISSISDCASAAPSPLTARLPETSRVCAHREPEHGRELEQMLTAGAVGPSSML